MLITWSFWEHSSSHLDYHFQMRRYACVLKNTCLIRNRMGFSFFTGQSDALVWVIIIIIIIIIIIVKTIMCCFIAVKKDKRVLSGRILLQIPR